MMMMAAGKRTSDASSEVGAGRSSSSGENGAPARPKSGAASSASTRPFSSSNLMASVANARFKSFQVQHEILSKNTVLSAIATEIPWKNLLDLFQLKFFAVGDALWQQGGPAHEMAFVLCGGFLARCMDYDVLDATASRSRSPDEQRLGSIRAEKLVKPGGSLAALAVHCGSPMQYSVVTAKFKSIVLTLPTGKYKSILRQLSPDCKALVEALLYDAENALLLALKRQPVALPTGASAASSRSHQLRQNATSPAKKLQHAPSSTAALQRSVSTPALLTGAVAAAAAAVIHPDATASWASLQVAKPVEYEVNSSLLILHESSSSKSTGSLPAAAAGVATGLTNNKTLSGARGALHGSSAARLAAKKHTQRRLQSIKFPNPLEAFPPPSKRLVRDGDSDASLLLLAEMALEETAIKRVGHLDVVPKMHVGRLLKPLRKPVMLRVDDDSVSDNTRGALRPHTVAGAEHVSQRVLVADRAEPFRDMW